MAARSLQPNGGSMGKRPDQPAPSLVKRGPKVGHASNLTDRLNAYIRQSRIHMYMYESVNHLRVNVQGLVSYRCHGLSAFHYVEIVPDTRIRILLNEAVRFGDAFY